MSWRRSSPRPSTSSRPASSSTAEQLKTPVGPDIDAHVESLRQYEAAGVDELYVQQVGPDKDAFFAEWASEVLPRFD